MSFDALTNRGEYLSAHYLAEVLPTTLKTGLLKRWTEEEKAGRRTPRVGLRGLRRDYFDAKTELADAELFENDRLRKFHQEVLRALGFLTDASGAQQHTLTVERAGREYEISVAHAELGTGHGILAVDCGWAVDADAAQDPDDAGRLLDEVPLDANETITSGPKLASWLFAADELRAGPEATPSDAPRYVLILSGGVITLADRTVWGEGRYLAVSLDTAFGRNDDKELDVIAALFGADSLRPPAEGGAEPLADLVAGSRQHAVGVSSDLREGLRLSVELIANEVLNRIRQAGYQPEQVMELDELADELRREALRYLYRILFLLYAEARPELGVLPVDDPEYVEGYSLARLGDLVARKLAPSAEGGFHLYESLDLLFTMVNAGHRPRGSQEVDEKASEDVGLRFEPMRSDLFLPEAIKLIGQQIPQPDADPDDPQAPRLDTRLRNATLYQMLRLLMLTKGSKKRRGGFISYAQLGINQLGAVYEGLMSYTGSIATEQLYEVAKNGDPKDGSWMIPASKVDEYEDSVFVVKEHPITGVRSRVSYNPGQFVYRLAGRDRQTSASYYTPHSLTEVTVQLALKYRLDQDGVVTPARELLDWTICEPALGSGAFLNEAINQVAAEYLRRRQDELEIALEPEQYHLELQRVKAYIALHNCYGVDLNRTAVELAEVSLWLNVMHKGLQAPWFGLHLQRANSLIGAGRRLYKPEQLADKSWLTTAPEDRPFRDGAIDDGTIHHFLLPADGWGAVAGEKEARELAPEETERLKKWRSAMKRTPKVAGKNSQVKRLQALARRVDFLWDLVQQRLTISEREIRRDTAVWGAEDLPPATEAVPREKILADLTTPGTPYWRLKTLMDTWCALWFWPLDKVGLLDGSALDYVMGPSEVTHVKNMPAYEDLAIYEKVSLFGDVEPKQLLLPAKTGTRKVSIAEQLNPQVTLADLEGWLAFAEALVGKRDITEGTIGTVFKSLDQLGDHEASLAGLMGMEQPHRLTDRFPWLHAARDIADEQGFFHWELTFAQAFARGGFDLQAGNPPWVRPRWEERPILAEHDPWFGLADKPDQRVWDARRAQSLEVERNRRYLLTESASIAGLGSFLSSACTYPMLVGTQPDLYRAFMCRVWVNITPVGTAGLLHPDTHFVGDKERALRRAAYRHLRVHGDFVNSGNRFFPPPVNRSSHFGVHIYGVSREVDFQHLSWLFDPPVLTESLRMATETDGSVALHGDPPGVRFKGTWDARPHPARVVRVTTETLAQWRTVAGDHDEPLDSVRLLYPVTNQEQVAIELLGAFPHRLGEKGPRISRGYDEAGAKKVNLIRWQVSEPGEWPEVILKGPQFGVATPFFKKPPGTGTGARPIDLTTLPSHAVPGTFYRRSCSVERFQAAQTDRWVDLNSPGPDREGPSPMRRSTEFSRAVWREQIPDDTDRSCFVCLFPPGPAHIHGVRSLALDTDRETALLAGFWAGLPVDYFLRVTGRGHLDVGDAKLLPAPAADHPLAEALLLRALRLNCLVSAYAGLWGRLFDARWCEDAWVASTPFTVALGGVSSEWIRDTPLRTELDRRNALVEIDSLVAVWLGLDRDQLVTIYRARFPIVYDYEAVTWFDARGRKIAGNFNTYGSGQTKEHWTTFQAYLEDPERNPVPDGYTAPFYKADRENEYRQAHAVFSERLQDAIDAGWQPS